MSIFSSGKKDSKEEKKGAGGDEIKKTGKEVDGKPKRASRVLRTR